MNPETRTARSTRRSAGLQSILNLLLIAAIIAMINYVGYRHYYHKDFSASQYYTLAPKTQAVLKKLDTPVTIYTYITEGTPQSQQIHNLLQEYQETAGKNLIIEKIDPEYNYDRASALQKELHFDGSDHVIIVSKKDRPPRFVKQEDLFDVNPMTGQIGGFKGEQALTGALLAVIEGKASRIYFTEGHGEHSAQDMQTPRGYGSISALLKTENVEYANLNIAQKGEVPDDADAVVIAGPQIALSQIEVDALAKYLDNNGKLMVLLDPYVVLGIDPLLTRFGLKYEDDIVLTRGMTTAGTVMTVPQVIISQGGFSPHPITKQLAQSGLNLIIYDARSISLPPDPGPQSKIQFLLQSDPGSWGWFRKGTVAGPDVQQLTYNKVTDIAGPVTIAAAFDGGMTTDPTTKATKYATRIVAVGASKFIENDKIETVGANVFINAVDWLVKKDAVLDIAAKKPQDYGITLNPISYRTLVWTAGLVIPGVALVLGIMTWLSRRK